MKPLADAQMYRKIIILALIATGILFGLFFVLLIPTIRAASKGYSDFLVQKKVAETLLNAGSTDTVMQSQAVGLEQSIARFSDSFLRKGHEIEFIQFLESLGRDNLITQTIQLNDPTLGKPNDFYPSALLVVKIRGTFLQFLHYLIDLERGPYYINVSTITLSNNHSDSLRIQGQNETNERPFTIFNAPTESAALPDEGDALQESVASGAPEITATIVGDIFWEHE